MLNKIKNLLSCHKGSSLISIMYVSLGIIMLIYVMLTYQSTFGIADKIKNNGQLMLDSYTIKTGKEIVSQIKSGNDHTQLLNENLFLKDYYTALEVDEKFECVKNSQLVFKMSDINASFIFDKSLKTEVSYNITLPLYFLGIKTFDVDVKVKLQSRYNLYIE